MRAISDGSTSLAVFPIAVPGASTAAAFELGADVNEFAAKSRNCVSNGELVMIETSAAGFHAVRAGCEARRYCRQKSKLRR